MSPRHPSEIDRPTCEQIEQQCAHYGGLHGSERCLLRERTWARGGTPARCALCPDKIPTEAEPWAANVRLNDEVARLRQENEGLRRAYSDMANSRPPPQIVIDPSKLDPEALAALKPMGPFQVVPPPAEPPEPDRNLATKDDIANVMATLNEVSNKAMAIMQYAAQMRAALLIARNDLQRTGRGKPDILAAIQAVLDLEPGL